MTALAGHMAMLALGGNNAYYTAVMATSPSIYWRLGDATATITDSSGNNVVGGLAGGYTQGQPSLVNDSNASTAFNGSTGFGYSNSLIPYSTSGTITAVIKTSSAAGGTIAGFASSNTGTPSAYDRFCYVDSAGKFRASTFVGGQRSMVSTTTVNDGVTHRVAFTWSPSGGALYVDGVQQATLSTFTGGDATGKYLRIAWIPFSTYPAFPPSYYLNGILDEITYHARALSAGEIAALNSAAI